MPDESGITFDFSAALYWHKHDAVNTVFPGVDFIVEEPTRQIWLEVKNWEPTNLPARRRGGQRRAFLTKLQSKPYFRDELRGKFIGTCSYLAMTTDPAVNDPLTKPIIYIALLESPRMDSALMSHATTRLRGLVRRSVWRVSVESAVVNLDEWNGRFLNYPSHPTV